MRVEEAVDLALVSPHDAVLRPAWVTEEGGREDGREGGGEGEGEKMIRREGRW